MSNKSKLKVGVVGCGGVGIIHARAYLENPAVEFVGICDTNEELARQQAARLNVAGYSSIAELVAQGKPDLVSVVVPPSKLVEPVAECLELGVNVLSEKPISFEPGEILLLMELADRKRLQLGVNFNQRFTPASQWFRQLRESGSLGNILYTISQYNQGTGDNFYGLREHMIHMLDFWRYHIGEVLSVTAQARWNEEERRAGRPSGVAVTLKFETGALGVFTNSFCRSGDLPNYYELVGEHGRCYCENFVGRSVFHPNNGPAQVKEPPCTTTPVWVSDQSKLPPSGVSYNAKRKSYAPLTTGCPASSPRCPE